MTTAVMDPVISSGRETSSDSRALELRVKALEQEVRSLREALVCSFNQMLDLRDLNTGVHSTRLAEWGMRVGRDLGVADRRMPDIEMGALLHDIGKVGVPDQILNKPGRLTA